MNFRPTITTLLSTIVLLSGCIGLVPTETPIPSIATVRADSPNDTLVIMLPGRGDRADTFIAHGFQKEGQRLGFDTLAVDAHFGYYMRRSLLPRLHEDIVVPARAAGYQNIWLLGISMGGFGSLLYAAEHSDEIDGIILLEPYLGDHKLAEEIDASGGLVAWSGEGAEFEDYEIGVWAWLQSAANGRSGTPIILGYGESDDSARTHAVLADALDSSSVYTLQGGHNWTTWRPLWKEIATDMKF
jgi:pimeloyl-ACP methyl ester carboxylesterase